LVNLPAKKWKNPKKYLRYIYLMKMLSLKYPVMGHSNEGNA
jgi:hypothetical protein